jgi:hypothetical protein
LIFQNKSCRIDRSKKGAESDKKIADHAVMAKQQFLSNMSHEIRTNECHHRFYKRVLIKPE